MQEIMETACEGFEEIYPIIAESVSVSGKEPEEIAKAFYLYGLQAGLDMRLAPLEWEVTA